MVPHNEITKDGCFDVHTVVMRVVQLSLAPSATGHPVEVAIASTEGVSVTGLPTQEELRGISL